VAHINNTTADAPEGALIPLFFLSQADKSLQIPAGSTTKNLSA